MIDEPKYTLQESIEFVDDLTAELDECLHVATLDLEIRLGEQSVLMESDGDYFELSDEKRRELVRATVYRLVMGDDFIVMRRPGSHDEELVHCDVLDDDEPTGADDRAWCELCGADYPTGGNTGQVGLILHNTSAPHAAAVQARDAAVLATHDRLSGYCSTCDDSFAIGSTQTEKQALAQHVKSSRHITNLQDAEEGTHFAVPAAVDGTSIIFCHVCKSEVDTRGDSPEIARSKHERTVTHQRNLPAEELRLDVPAIPSELCGVRGCVKLAGHGQRLDDRGNIDHSWEKGEQ